MESYHRNSDFGIAVETPSKTEETPSIFTRMNRSFKNWFADPGTGPTSSVDCSDLRKVRWVCSRRTIVIKRKLKSEDIQQLYSKLDGGFSSDESESSSDLTSNLGSDSESEEINKEEIMKMLNIITKESENQKIGIQKIRKRIKKMESKLIRLHSEPITLHRSKPPNSE